jgi:hypothetical protein
MDRIITDITPEVRLGVSRYTISRPYAATQGWRANEDLPALVIQAAQMPVSSIELPPPRMKRWKPSLRKDDPTAISVHAP